ncbi:unnamed protein product [Diatraea saccharalis]|uniref:LITAF domain-containing protein n=1 Tax=Diatraea saccharalis TaxID=40085 RepID=A0A9N9QTM3_9NEOP|nr:unnamed protein product [Diatraea saccharalis]
MNNDTLPLYPGPPGHVSHLPLQKINDTPSDSSTVTAVAPSPMFTKMTLLLGPENAVTTCPFCQASVRTNIKHTTTTRTHITAVLCSFICCCCCIPYCCDSAKNTDHYCPSCLKYIGTYEK